MAQQLKIFLCPIGAVFGAPIVEGVPRQPMPKKRIGMAFDREIFVRSGKENILRHPQHFIQEQRLLRRAIDMLDDCIAEYPVKLIVTERKYPALVSDEFLVRVLGGQFAQVLYSQADIGLATKPETFHKHVFASHACSTGYACIENFSTLAKRIEMIEFLSSRPFHQFALPLSVRTQPVFILQPIQSKSSGRRPVPPYPE